MRFAKLLIIMVLVFGVADLINAKEKTPGKFSGLVFYDFTYEPDNGPKTNEFELHRVYLTYQHKLADNLSYKFQVDVGRLSKSSDVRMVTYLKNAKVDWKTELGTLIFGLQGMNVFNVQEKTWGLRFIEKSAMDQRKFSSSADLGVGYGNKIGKNLHFTTIISNGSGYKKPEIDKYKKISTQLVFGEKKLVKKDGFNIGGVFTFEPYEVDSVTTKSKTLFGVFGGYAKKAIRVGAEFDQLREPGSDVTKRIISLYASYTLHKSVEGFARLDMYDPNTNAGDNAINYVIAGFCYQPVKGLCLAPNLRYTKPQSGDSAALYKLNFEYKF